MRRLVFTCHLYIALVASLLVATLAATGIIVAFEPELDHVLHWRLSYVRPADRPLHLTEIGAAAATVFPGEAVSSYELSDAPNLSYRVRFAGGVVFVNPYTGVVLGWRAKPDLPSRFLLTSHRIHVSLLPSLGASGGTALSWAAAALIFLLTSGLYLWWPLRRVRRVRGTKGRRFWSTLHNATGVWALPFVLTLALTGMAIGFQQTTQSLVFRITGFQPPTAATLAAPIIAWRHLTPDEAIDIARQALPGAAPFDISVPAPRGHYQIRMRFPEDRTPGGRSRVVVDQYSGTVLAVQSSRAAPAATRILNTSRAIHTGDVFGLSSKIVATLSCLALLSQIATGAMMWWKRSGRTGSSAKSSPPSPKPGGFA